jgi:hypothetical protein
MMGLLLFSLGAAAPPLSPYLGLAGLAVAGPLIITTFLLNWPKPLVPPPFRGERGALFESFAKTSND